MGVDGIRIEHVGALAPGLLLVVIDILDGGCGPNMSEETFGCVGAGVIER